MEIPAVAWTRRKILDRLELGPILFNLRNNVRGLTQEKVGKLTGVNPADLSQFECARRSPSFETLKRLTLGLEFRLIIEGGEMYVEHK